MGLQSEFPGDGRSHTQFLGDTVDEVKAALRIHNRQRYTGESSAGTHIDKRRTRSQRTEKPGDGQRVQDMIGVQVADILARYHIDGGVPLRVQRPQSLESRALGFRQVKISCDNFYILHNKMLTMAWG